MKYIIYTVAALVGFHLCWLAAYLGGWTGYRANGANLIVSAACVLLVREIRVALKKKKNRS